MLLLDEMLSPVIADRLTESGCEALAISSSPDLRGVPDVDVLALAAEHGRVLVTGNIRDFVPLASSWAAQGRTHPGILLVSSKTFPMSRGRSGRITAALLTRFRAGSWPAPGQVDFLRP